MLLLRRLRGIAIASLLWAVVWGLGGALGYVVAGIHWTLAAGRPLTPAEVLQYAPIGALFLSVYGLLGGAAFTVLLMLLERRRTLEDLSLRRVAAWGALGGIGILVLNTVEILLLEDRPVPGDLIPVSLIMACLGALCAAGTIVLARRAPASALR